MKVLCGICVCLLFFGFCLYSYIDRYNAVLQLRIEVPKLTRAVKEVKEENMRLQYRIQEFESPEHLMKLCATEPFSHLKFPLLKEVITLKEGTVIARATGRESSTPSGRTHVALAARAH
jgi:hypothetical protein